MNAKEIKSLLKEAREALRKKEYNDALKIAENVLQYDNDNYNALIFVGAAAQEINELEKAENAFRKAIRNSPSQILGWQGWCAFCEKSLYPKHKEELLTIYTKLIELHDDVDKQFDTMGKLAQFHIGNNDIDSTMHILEKQKKLAVGNATKEQQVLEAMIKVLLSVEILSEHLGQRLMDSLSKILMIEEVNLEAKKQYAKEYMKCLLKENDEEKIMTEARKWMDLDENFIFPREVICTLFIASVIDKKNFGVKNMKQIVEKLLNIDPDNNCAILAQLALNFTSNEKDLLAANLSHVKVTNTVEECLLLLLCFLSVHHYENAIKFSQKGLNLCEKLNAGINSSRKIELKVGMIYAELSIGDKNKIEKNIEVLEDFLTNEKSDKLLSLIVKSYLKIGNVDKANKVCCRDSWTDVHLSDAFLGVILKSQNKPLVAKEKLESARNRYKSDTYFALELALLLRDLKDFSKSLSLLLNALKEDSYNPELFLQVGNHYKLFGDVNKALRCYKKAYLINGSEEAAKCLSDTYTQTEQEEENFNLLTHLATITPNRKWILVRLGLYYYKQNDLTAAIKSLQSALNTDYKDSHCWESLADCYFARGSFTAALKSYARALELNATSVYCCYQLAKIKQLLQDYAGASEDYGKILSEEPNYIPALKGYGEVKLLQANCYLQECLIGLSRDCCEKAIEVFCSAVLIESGYLCLWKLLGDACTFVNNFSSDNCFFQIPTSFAQISKIESGKLNKKQLLALGTRCYGKALSLHENAELWHDVAVNYHHRALHAEEGNEKNEYFENALTAHKKAVSMNSQNTVHWNALGVTAARMKNYALSQHSFINAIKTDENNAIAWTNLGVIYLINNDVELAHQSFAMAQTLDPCYINCWIGMAAIAERVDHSDAMDLFRHTTSLGNHTESELGYADWVVRTLLQSETDKRTKLYEYWMENMSAISTSSDCMTRYTNIIKNDSQAYNMLGLLLEKQRLYLSAKVAFEKALALETEIKKIDMIRSNYARVLSSLGEYKLAESHYVLIKEPDFTSQCGLALCYYKNGSFTESYQAYEAAIHWFDKSDGDKSHVYVALAAIAYQLNDINKVKSLLFQSSVLQPLSVHGILGLYALGLLQSDFVLIEASLKELLPFAKHPVWMKNVIFLLAATVLLQGKNVHAQRIVSKALHEFPWHHNLWTMVAKILVQFPQINSVVADKCSTSAITLAQDSLKNEHDPILKMANLNNLAHLSNGRVSKCLKSAQTAVHLYPSDISNWSCLIASAMLADGSYKRTCERKWFFKLLKYSIFCASKNTKLKCWLEWYECLTKLAVGLKDEAANALQNSTDWKCERAVDSISVLQWLLVNIDKQAQTINVGQLQQCVQEKPNFVFAWQVLVNSCVVLEKYSDAEKVLQYWYQLAQIESSERAQSASLLVLLNFATEKYQETKEKSWLELCESKVNESAKMNCQAVTFLLARLNHLKGNKKKTKKYFELLLTQKNIYKYLSQVAQKYLS